MPATDWRRQMRLAGPFQQLVLIALVRLGRDTSASMIRREIEARTGRHISITAVHTTLQRLAARGYTRSWTRPIFPRLFVGDGWKHCSLSMLSNAARRFHTLLTLGRRALRLALEAEDLIRNGLPGLGREELPFRRLQPWLRMPDPGKPHGGRWSYRRRIE